MIAAYNNNNYRRKIARCPGTCRRTGAGDFRADAGGGEAPRLVGPDRCTLVAAGGRRAGG